MLKEGRSRKLRLVGLTRIAGCLVAHDVETHRPTVACFQRFPETKHSGLSTCFTNTGLTTYCAASANLATVPGAPRFAITVLGL
jgi:hypothetical protein